MRFSRSTSAWSSPTPRRKTRQYLPEVALTKLGVLVYRAGEEALTERAVGHETDAQFLARLENAIALRPTRPKRILVLKRGDRLNLVGAADGLRTRLREAKMLHLAFLDQGLDRAGHVLDWQVRVDTMLLKEINHLDAEPLQRGIAHLTDVLRPAVEARLLLRLGVDIEAELCGNHHLVPHPSPLAELVHAVQEYRRIAESKLLTLQGSEYPQAVHELNKAIDRAEGLLITNLSLGKMPLR